MLEFGQPSFSVFSLAAHSSGSLRYRRWTKRSNPEEVQSSHTPFLFSSRVKMGGQIRNPKNIHCLSLVKRTQWNIDIWGAGCRVSLLGFEYFVHWNLRGNEKDQVYKLKSPKERNLYSVSMLFNSKSYCIREQCGSMPCFPGMCDTLHSVRLVSQPAPNTSS